MPIYEFRCASCGQIFEQLLAYDATEPPCPSCSEVETRRLISVVAGLGGRHEPAASSGGGCGGACACAN